MAHKVLVLPLWASFCSSSIFYMGYWRDKFYNYGRGFAYREGKAIGKLYDTVYKYRNTKWMRAIADTLSPGVGLAHQYQGMKGRGRAASVPTIQGPPSRKRKMSAPPSWINGNPLNGRNPWGPQGFGHSYNRNRTGKHRSARLRRHKDVNRAITRKLARMTPQPNYYRDCKLETAQYENAINKCTHQVLYNGTKADCDELYVKPKIPVYYDPAGGTSFGWYGVNPSATDFGNVGTWKCFLKHALYATLQNNYNAPVRLQLFYGRYICEDSDNPVEIFTQDMVDLGHDNSSPTVQTDPRYAFHLGVVGKKKLKITGVKKLMLQPGESTAIKMVHRIQYDPEQATNTYLKGTQFVVIRMAGQIAHDTTNVALVGTSESKLDLTLKTYRVACLRQNYQLKTIGHDIGSYDNIVDAEIIDEDHPDPVDVDTTT